MFQHSLELFSFAAIGTWKDGWNDFGGGLHLVPAGVLETAKPLTPARKSRLKRHSCRVRRKRERLPSNGLIQSNPAIGSSLYSGLPAPGTPDKVLTLGWIQGPVGKRMLHGWRLPYRLPAR